MFEISFRRLICSGMILLSLLAAWLAVTRHVDVSVLPRDDHHIFDELGSVRLRFWIPISHKALSSGLEVLPPVGSGLPRPSVSLVRLSATTYRLDIAEGPVKGLVYRIAVKARSMLWPLTVKRIVAISKPVHPRLIDSPSVTATPTRGPVVLRFNTPIDHESLRTGVRCPVPGIFTPLDSTIGSAWAYYPSRALCNSTNYTLTVTTGVKSICGLCLRTPATVNFTTAPALRIAAVYPRDGSQKTWLTRDVRVQFNAPVRSAVIRVKGHRGTSRVDGDTVRFEADLAWKPGVTYTVEAAGLSQFGESATVEYTFTVTDIGPVYWLDCTVNEVRLMKGARLEDSFSGSVQGTLPKMRAVTLYVESIEPGSIHLNAGLTVTAAVKPGQGNGRITVSDDAMKVLVACLKPKSMVILHTAGEEPSQPSAND